MGNVWAALRVLADSDSTDGVDTDEVVSATVDVVTVLLGVGIGIAVGVLIAVIIQLISRFALRKHSFMRETVHSAANSLEFVLGVGGAWIGMRIAWPENSGTEGTRWRALADHGLQILFILAVTWFVARAFTSVEATMLNGMKRRGDSRYLRKQMQLEILHRILIVVVWMFGISAILLTFSWGKTLGSALFTSAGLFSVVVGIAAQSTLGNVFAGLQLAFSDSIRMGDIVVWQEEFTTVEEITLTYVVLKSWDGRRLIVPSKEMVGSTFENWTRRSPKLLGKVEFDVDWKVPIDGMRKQLNVLLKHTNLWDGETGILQVTDTAGGRIQLAALVSGSNSAEVSDLKLYIREEMVKWLQRQAEASEGGEESVETEDSGDSGDSSGLVDPNGNVLHSGDDDVRKPSDTFETATVGPTVEDVTATQVIDVSDMPLLYPARVPVEERETSDSAEEEDTETHTTGHQSAMFTGSESAEKRAEEFSGPGEEAYHERDAAYERKLAEETQVMSLDDIADGEAEGTDADSTAAESAETPAETEVTKTSVMEPVQTDDAAENTTQMEQDPGKG
ncbi:mechanosensitive ion channel family protein [Ancrocorticia populi]|uniref:mechanosensitive ion channel family protein n=1 Tax=Ancrocorticia populi TaxID=2175228 RepID=UPI003F8E22CB